MLLVEGQHLGSCSLPSSTQEISALCALCQFLEIFITFFFKKAKVDLGNILRIRTSETDGSSARIGSRYVP
jgi:hypothetical protein